MEDYIVAGAVFALIVFAGAVGLQLQRMLPESWTTGGARDMTGAVVGLLTLQLALVLGLLIWTAFGVFATQKASIQGFALNALRYDQALAEFGPETADGRRQGRETLRRTIEQVWTEESDGDFVVDNYGYELANTKAREAFINSLEPKTDAQRAAKAAAQAASAAMGQTRTSLALALVDPICYPLLIVVVSWAALLFCGYGLLSKRHPMSFVALVVGALTVSSSIYTISDLSSPYSGWIAISPAPIADVLRAASEAAAPAGARR